MRGKNHVWIAPVTRYEFICRRKKLDLKPRNFGPIPFQPFKFKHKIGQSTCMFIAQVGSLKVNPPHTALMKCDVRHIHGKKFKRESRLSVRIHLWTNQIGKKAREPAGLFFFYAHSIRSAASLERVRTPIVFSICISTFLNYFHC